MRKMAGLNELREQGRMTWIGQEHGWVAVLEEIVDARRDRRPAGGVWEGVDALTGSVASAIWVNRPAWDHALVFNAIDGESLKGGRGER